MKKLPGSQQGTAALLLLLRDLISSSHLSTSHGQTAQLLLTPQLIERAVLFLPCLPSCPLAPWPQTLQLLPLHVGHQWNQMVPLLLCCQRCWCLEGDNYYGAVTLPDCLWHHNAAQDGARGAEQQKELVVFAALEHNLPFTLACLPQKAMLLCYSGWGCCILS